MNSTVLFGGFMKTSSISDGFIPILLTKHFRFHYQQVVHVLKAVYVCLLGVTIIVTQR